MLLANFTFRLFLGPLFWPKKSIELPPRGLEAAGFGDKVPAVFLAEGLIMYLKEGVSWKGEVNSEPYDQITRSCRFGDWFYWK